MRGVILPERTEDFTADPVELFFDLAFVFAFSQIVSVLIHDPTPGGLGHAGLVFLLLWIPWTQFSWSANAVSGNGRVVRTLFLVATVASVPMAASVTTALGGGGPIFSTMVAVILAMGLATMLLGLERGSEERRSLVRYAAFNGVGGLVIVAGGFVPGAARPATWVAGLLVIVAGTVLAGRGSWIIRAGHFAERHGLIIIVALGEVIVAIAAPVADVLEADEGLSGATLLALLGAGAFAGLLWWGYFDRPGPAFEHRAAGLADADRGRFARDVYTYLHAPIVAGVILAAAALEEIALHPADPVPAAFRAMLAGGLVLYLLGVAGGVGRAFGVVIRERTAATAVIVVLAVVAVDLAGVVLLLLVVGVMLTTLVVEHLRVEGRPGSRPADV